MHPEIGEVLQNLQRTWRPGNPGNQNRRKELGAVVDIKVGVWVR